MDKSKAKASVDKSKINLSYRLNGKYLIASTNYCSAGKNHKSLINFIDEVLADSSRSCAKNGFHEKDILNHSAASAFSRFFPNTY